MEKIIICLCVILVLAQSVFGDVITDVVRGNDLGVLSFEDELGIINNLVYNDEIRKSSNKFEGNFLFDSDSFSSNSKDVKFRGRMNFLDRSYVTYSLEKFVVEETSIDPFGATDVFGRGVFVYEAVIRFRKEIPVTTVFSFYQDIDYADSFSQNILLTGDNFMFELQDEGKQKFKHKRKCVGEC